MTSKIRYKPVAAVLVLFLFGTEALAKPNFGNDCSGCHANSAPDKNLTAVGKKQCLIFRTNGTLPGNAQCIGPAVKAPPAPVVRPVVPAPVVRPAAPVKPVVTQQKTAAKTNNDDNDDLENVLIGGLLGLLIGGVTQQPQAQAPQQPKPAQAPQCLDTTITNRTNYGLFLDVTPTSQNADRAVRNQKIEAQQGLKFCFGGINTLGFDQNLFIPNKQLGSFNMSPGNDFIIRESAPQSGILVIQTL